MTKKIEKNTETFKATETPNVAELIWDGWLNSFKTVQGLQSELEEKSLKAFDYQKELLGSTRESLSSLEKQSEELTLEWKERFAGHDQLQPISNWIEIVEGLNNKSQISPWSPGYTVMDFISSSQEQFEVASKKAVKQQQQGRDEVLQKVVEATEQAKQKQKSLLAKV